MCSEPRYVWSVSERGETVFDVRFVAGRCYYFLYGGTIHRKQCYGVGNILSSSFQLTTRWSEIGERVLTFKREQRELWYSRRHYYWQLGGQRTVREYSLLRGSRQNYNIQLLEGMTATIPTTISSCFLVWLHKKSSIFLDVHCLHVSVFPVFSTRRSWTLPS